MVRFKIEYFVPSWTTDETENHARLDFCLIGEPFTQNGWKVKWRGLPIPIIYDPRSREKTALRRALKRAMVEANVPGTTFFPPAIRLSVRIYYFQDGAHDKDLDNMTKFLGDAMEGAIYPDDKMIWHCVTEKEESIEPRTVVSVERQVF